MAIPSWVIGVILAMLAAAAAAIGDNCVKRSFRLAAESELKGVPPPMLYMRPLWLFGIFCIVVLNTGLNLGSYAFADASLTIPLGGLHILFNLPLSVVMNKERLSLRSTVCNIFIAIGVIIVLIVAPKEETNFSVHEMFENLSQPLFIVFSIVLACVALFYFNIMNHKNATYRRAGFTGFTGILGATTQVVAKTMSLSLKDESWSHPFFWASVVLTIVLALSQVYFLNRCLELFETTFVVPIVNSILTCIGSIYAAVYFDEIQRWNKVSDVLMPLGICITALGIALLSTETYPTPALIDEIWSDCEDHGVDSDLIPLDSSPLLPRIGTMHDEKLRIDKA